MTTALYLLAGLAILLAALLPSALSRLAISPPIVLLGAGMAIGLLPIGDRLLDPVDNREVVEQVTQFAVLLALMGVGLALDRPLRLRRLNDWRRWSATWRLLFVAMPVTIGAIWLLGWWGLGLGAAPTPCWRGTSRWRGQMSSRKRRTRVTSATRSGSPSPRRPG